MSASPVTKRRSRPRGTGAQQGKSRPGKHPACSALHKCKRQGRVRRCTARWQEWGGHPLQRGEKPEPFPRHNRTPCWAGGAISLILTRAVCMRYLESMMAAMPQEMVCKGSTETGGDAGTPHTQIPPAPEPGAPACLLDLPWVYFWEVASNVGMAGSAQERRRIMTTRSGSQCFPLPRGYSRF